MALAAPVHLSMSTAKVAQLDARSRQKQPFDADLLRSKLEAHKRDLEGIRLQKEKRDLERKQLFVPQTAARQFAATATPMKDFRPSQNVRPTTQPATAGHRMSLNPKQLLAARNAGMSENEAVAAICHANEAWRKGSLGKPSAETGGPLSPRKPREQSPCFGQMEHTRRRLGFQETRSAASYRPGDAEKRRMEEIKISFRDVAFGPKEDIRLSWHAAQAVPGHRQTREKEENMPYDLRMTRVDEMAAPRPRLKQQNRPNWSQISQNSDDMRRTLHLPRLHLKQKVEHQAEHTDDDFVPRSMSECRGVQATVSQDRRASENMISDAVKIIKKEEKVRRRGSVMAFFRKVL